MAQLTKILFFIKGIAPTEQERQAAIKVGTLTFRSLESYHDTDFLEDCAGVAGEVPARYLEKFPKVEPTVEVPPVPVKVADPSDPPKMPTPQIPAPPPPPPLPPVTPPVPVPGSAPWDQK